MELREYQKEAINACINNYSGSHLLQLATGLGKTVIFSHIPRDGRTLVLANRKELVYQNGKYFDCDVDIEMANNRSGNAPVISASIQTMNTRYEQFAPDEFTSIYIDECHTTVGNGKSLEVLNYFKPKRIFGFTATPNRSQRGGLGHIFDDIIFERDVKWGIENGYLCPVECKRVNIGYDLTKIKTVKGDYAQGELSEEMEKEVNIQACVEAYHKHARGQTVIFTASVKQAHDIADRIDGAIAVSGKTPEKERKEILEAYERKEIKCICNCAVLTYGWDSPITETLLMMKPTQSSNLWIQMAGRALRLHSEKEKALIIDCVGVSNKPLCSSCTLIGIDESTVPERLREKLEGDILQLPDIVEQLADTPESWIKNVKIVDLFAKENKIKTQNLNVFLHADGRMIISLPERQKIIIPAPDLIGMVKVKDLTWIPREWEEFTKNKYGDKMPLQTAINAAKATLKKNYPNCSMIWDLTKAKKWGKQEPTEAQMRSIANKTKKKGLEIPQGINRLEASMILNRLNNK